MNKTLVEILHAAERAKRKHPEAYGDTHAAYCILMEEVCEFYDEIAPLTHESVREEFELSGDPLTSEMAQGYRARARQELLDIAAVVYRALENESLWREPK